MRVENNRAILTSANVLVAGGKKKMKRFKRNCQKTSLSCIFFPSIFLYISIFFRKKMKELVQFFNFFLAILFFHTFTSAFRFFQSLFMYSSSCDYHHHLFFVFPVLPRNMPAIIHIKNTIFVIYNREFYWDPTRAACGGRWFFLLIEILWVR